ncbi:MAG: hypothetical protein ABSG89_10475 [Bacteroidales bacterium]|jgi:hypothetical protein
MKRLGFYLIAIIGLLAASCAPNALMMKGGEKLNDRITSAKTTVAVLPVVDWSEDEGFCKGWLLYGCAGAFKRTPAYDNVGLTVTNSLTEALWKKNRMKMVNKQVLLDKLPQDNLQKNDIFPKPEYGFLGLQAKYPKSPEDAGYGKTPNYDLLYKAGEDIGADVILIARVSKNTQTAVLPQNPVGISIPGLVFPISLVPTVVISAAYNYYWIGIKKVKTVYIVIHIMALDVKKHEVIAFGGFNKFNQIPLAQKDKAMEEYSAAMTFYAPMPDREDLKKEFLANAGSWAGTQVANALLQELGIYIPITFSFKYEYGDETWKSYPEGYFMKNFGLTPDEYKKLLKN